MVTDDDDLVYTVVGNLRMNIDSISIDLNVM